MSTRLRIGIDVGGTNTDAVVVDDDGNVLASTKTATTPDPSDGIRTALEQVIVDFWDKQIDVLVCTTIVESGIDIANANTLIVDRADTFGLSQLHQLRGRVGRGRERAYAYFLYPPEKPLTETAHDRLATMAAHTDLGAGMAIAMKDLELRGAGNILGAEQSGHIAGVGFDLYLRMIGEAVSEFRGDSAPEQTELRLELPVDARVNVSSCGYRLHRQMTSSASSLT